MSILIMMIFSLSILFFLMKHPISMGTILLLQTLVISMITGNLTQNFWFSYILFLIMVGGMLILFMYMTSIASNEKFKFNSNMFLLIIVPLVPFFSNQFSLQNISNNETMEFNKSIEMTFILNKFMNFPAMIIIIFMMLYLLLTLIASVKITNFKMGSIRQMN